MPPPSARAADTVAPRRLSPVAPYALALGASVAASTIRLGGDGALHGRAPLLLNVIVVLCAAHFAGVGPAIASIAVAAVTAVLLYTLPSFGFHAGDAATAMMFALNFAIMASAVALAHAARRDRQRAGAESAARARADRRAADSLRRFDRHLRLAHRAARMGTWELDPATSTLFLPETTRDLFALPPATSSGAVDAFLADVVHPDDLPRLREMFRRAGAAPPPDPIGSDFEITFRAISAAGAAPRWFTARGHAPPAGSDGAPTPVAGVFLDVTHAKAIEEQLDRSRELFERIADATPDVLYLYDLLERRAVYVNPGAATVLGYPPAQLKALSARDWPDLVHPDDVPRLAAEYARFPSQPDGAVLEHEYRMRAADGAWRWLRSRDLVFSRAPDGRPKVILGVARDVSGERTAAEALRTSESRYRSLVSATANVVYTTDPHGAFADSQPAWQAYTGQTADEYADFGWTNAVHPDDRPPLLDAWHKARSAHALFAAEARLRHAATGSHRHATFRAIPVRDGAGAVREWVGAVTDVHEQRTAERALALSEERVRIAADAAQLGTFYCEFPLGRIVWNDVCKDHFFLDRDAEVDFDLFYARLHPDDRQPTRAAIDRAIAERTPYDVEYRTVSPDGAQTHWIRAIGKVYFDPAGNPTRFDGVTLNVTERKHALLELEAARLTAEDASNAKDRFLAVLSHELRTPLTPALTGVQLLEDDPATPAHLLDIVRMIRRNVDLEARLIDDLLDLTRIARGRLSLHTDTVDAHEKIDNVLDICASDFKAKRLTLATDLRAAHHHVTADGARIQQVLWNILKNAAKFTPESGTITIRTCNAPAHAGGPPSPPLVIDIADTGAGIPAEYLPSIFNAFDQGNTETSRRLGGLGLGLTISKALVDLHGGSIGAASDGPGKGATFTVTLPTVPAPAPANGSPSAPAQPPAKKSLSILVVEDHPDTARAVSLLLRTRGHRVVLADSVATGLATASLEPFDLLISDIGLPDGSGHDLMRQLLARRRYIKAICLSGFGMEDDIRRSKEAGFLEHLTKPITFHHLESAIQKVTAP